MKSAKTLSLSLGIVCSMTLGSCSKDEIQTPQPQEMKENASSSLKTSAATSEVAPYCAWWAESQNGLGYYPLDWTKGTSSIPNDLEVVPTGVSTLDNLWGSPYTPWVKKLPAIPDNPRPTKILTLESIAGFAGSSVKLPSVTTTLKNLTPGKTYAITLYFATTVRDKTISNNIACAYAKTAQVKLFPDNNGVALTTNVDLTGKEAQWVKKTITFTPTKDKVPLYFLGVQPQSNTYTFTHFYVGFSSFRELTPMQFQTTL